MIINPEHYFVLCTGQQIKSLEELVTVLKNIDQKTFEFHVNESKNDFASWINFVFKSKRLAENIGDYGFHEKTLMIHSIKKCGEQNENSFGVRLRLSSLGHKHALDLESR